MVAHLHTPRVVSAIALLLVGVGLLTIQADRSTILLPPTPGVDHAITLEGGHEYTVQFVANRASITRIGLYLTKTNENISGADLNIITRNAAQEVLGSSSLPLAFIDNEKASQWRFSTPLPNAAGETIRISLTPPPELNGAIRLKTTLVDGTFKSEDTSLYLGQSGTNPNPEPAAYEVYTTYHPPLAMQLGGLLLLSALYIVVPAPKNQTAGRIYSLLLGVVLSVIACLPALVLGGRPYLLLLTQTCAFYGAYWWLRTASHSRVASFLGASIFAYTSWFALQLGADRTLYALAAGLPLIASMEAPTSSVHSKWVSRVVYIVLFTSALMTSLLFDSSIITFPSETASLRDIFLDPNQTQYSIKTVNPALPWDHFGAYIGIIPLALAVVGMVRRQPHWQLLSTLVIGGVLVSMFPLAAHLTIILVWLVSFFAASGIDRLRVFLGTNDRLVQLVVWAIAIIVLLDMWQVLTPILEYPLL